MEDVAINIYYLFIFDLIPACDTLFECTFMSLVYKVVCFWTSRYTVAAISRDCYKSIPGTMVWYLPIQVLTSDLSRH